MSNITTFKSANLPSVQSLSTALRSLEAEVGPTGTVIIKMDKTGHWVFGAEQTEIQDGSTWAVNPFSFIHGFIAWGDGEVLGEKMVSVAEPLPEMDVAPPGINLGKSHYLHKSYGRIYTPVFEIVEWVSMDGEAEAEAPAEASAEEYAEATQSSSRRRRAAV
jgi:hypothetical protein